MYRLEIEINERVARELYIFCKEQKLILTTIYNTCSDFAKASELGEDFTIYDDIELKLEELA